MDHGAGDEQPPPIPLAPDGPGRAYGTAQGSAHGGVPGGQGGHPGHPGQGAQTGYGAPGPYGAAGYGAYGGAHVGGYGPAGPAAPGGGAGAYSPYGYGWQGPPLPAGRSIAAMVVGIASVVLILTCWGSFLSVLSSTVALCLGVSARRAVDRGELGGRPQATAGFVLGIVGLALSVIVSTLLVLGLTVWSDDGDDGDPGSGGGGDSYNAGGGRAPVALTLSSVSPAPSGSLPPPVARG
ncbi:DUF4190 domain-containing protein [Streptomyces albus subsp. chlorinus]|uniref:DUF4190 domain-containing protein n=1 Tax=Streptomyces albus TaxID=1888 RepID=UPI00156DC63F|nr:DUF4190 domain-containing protein [Streptomyces albus]NSC24179.1 DUF4190 domain-containing protein [Streptomyces albus subsp. chlorinus]